MANGNNNLKKNLEKWAELQRELTKLEESIKAKVMSRKETVRHGGAVASFSNGRGSYDYETAAKNTKTVTKDIVEICTKPVIDWNKVCKMASLELDQASKYYKAGNPGVSIKLDKTVIA